MLIAFCSYKKIVIELAKSYAENEDINCSDLLEAYYHHSVGRCTLMFMHEDISASRVDTTVKVITINYK